MKPLFLKKNSLKGNIEFTSEEKEKFDTNAFIMFKKSYILKRFRKKRLYYSANKSEKPITSQD